MIRVTALGQPLPILRQRHMHTFTPALSLSFHTSVSVSWCPSVLWLILCMLILLRHTTQTHTRCLTHIVNLSHRPQLIVSPWETSLLKRLLVVSSSGLRLGSDYGRLGLVTMPDRNRKFSFSKGINWFDLSHHRSARECRNMVCKTTNSCTNLIYTVQIQA